MAELQTIAACLDLLKLTWEIGKFLKRIAEADRTALEVSGRIKRLRDVLQGIFAVLEAREECNPGNSTRDTQIVERIRDTVISCMDTLTKLPRGFGTPSTQAPQTVGRSLLERTKIAVFSTAITRINGELEAQVHILGTDLNVLQLLEQTRASSRIESNHEELLLGISHLGEQVNEGNRILEHMLNEHHKGALHRRISSVAPNEAANHPRDDAIERLTECMRAASDVHERYTERYTSAHEPDSQSERLKHAFIEQLRNSPGGMDTPLVTIGAPSSRGSGQPGAPVPPSGNEDEGCDDDGVWPLDILNMHINAYTERASIELDAQHFGQAEVNLGEAIRNSEAREIYYGVEFRDRAQMQEQLALLYQKQRKWAEAVSIVSKLLRERSSSVASTQSEMGNMEGLVQARQHQLLASIYCDRQMNSTDGAVSHWTDDIEKAENHARKAFSKRYNAAKSIEMSEVEKDQYNDCIHLLVRILEAREKTVEAIQIGKLVGSESSNCSDSLHRILSSNTHQPVDLDALDRHELLIDAIKSGDRAYFTDLLSADGLDLERLKQGKTLLMHAVEHSDNEAVQRLLDPDVGAYIETPTKQGQTALHLAAANGLHNMARCLLQHGAEVEARDEKSETPAMKAVMMGDAFMVEMLFHANPGALRHKGTDEWSMLHLAVRKSTPAMATVLLDLAPELKEAIDLAGKTALHHCADSERFEQATVLLNHRHSLDVNANDSISRTPLHLAACKAPTPQRERIVELLLSKGAVVDDRKPPLRIQHYACYTAIKRQRTVPRLSRAFGRLAMQ